MGKTLLIIIILSFSFATQAKYASGLIVAGDSWAYLPCYFGSVHRAFGELGLDVNVVGCLDTSQAGARAENYLNSKAHQEAIELVKKYSHIKAIHLSLGGNDMFRGWNKNMSQEQEMLLFNTIKDNIKAIIQSFHDINPKISILVNGYDYGYQYDNNPIKPYREIYEKMGKPNAQEVNSCFLRFSKVIGELRSEKVFYMHHHGLMHYHFGVPENAIKPERTLKPDFISSIQEPQRHGGVVEARNSPEAMARIGFLYTDPHHLSPLGYDYLMKHSINNYLKNLLY
ncbi:MAG: SGNH/GDSL hydrolase family protein [Oligoflexia bacterium]|nr:SGNH/GDSL hydrolase family protein [Oligoflexia bacterium]